MNFVGEPIIKDAELFNMEVEGTEFFAESWTHHLTCVVQQPGFVFVVPNSTRTRFYIKAETIDSHLDYPSHYSRNRYREQYGPYSVETFANKVHALYNSFHDSEKMRDNQRVFVRKMWVFKKLFETFENSMELILVRLSKMIPSMYGKAVNAIENAEAQLASYDARARKYAEISLVVIRRVHQKVVDILVERPQIFKLLSPQLLEKFVKDASPYMVAKIKCLPWIEPEIVLMAEPNYNIYWTLVWHAILLKHFKLSSEICYEIAEYMPVKLRGETFLDYFRRKYNAKKSCFHGERAFAIERSVTSENNCYFNNITIVL